MATILFNGVETDASALVEGTGLADRLTARGGAGGLAAGLDGLEADLDDGDDLIELDANGEDADVTLNGADGDDVITAIGGDPDEVDFIFPKDIGGTISGDAGDDTITFGDGLAVLTGTVSGGDDEDSITVANADSASIAGGNDDDTINLGFADGYGTAAGSRAAAAITDSTITGDDGDDTINVNADLTGSTVNASAGDDTITANDAAIDDSMLLGDHGDDVIIATGVSLTNASIKGNEDNDSITVSGLASGEVVIAGNDGDDEIDATGLIHDGIQEPDEGDDIVVSSTSLNGVTVRGGFGHDTIRGGNGQDLYGGLGADIFSIEAAGGATIKDYDRFEVDVRGGEDYDCDDQIQIDGHKIFLTTYNYGVDVDINSSATNFTGNLKVRGSANAVYVTTTANAFVAGTDTQTITAVAVAKGYISGPTGTTETLPQVQYPSTSTFGPSTNALSGLTSASNNAYIFRNATSNAAPDAMRGSGLGYAYAEVEGVWTANTTTSKGKFRALSGQIRSVAIQTYNQFEQDDFNISVSSGSYGNTGYTYGTQTIIYNDVISGTIKNHSAVYNTYKSSEAVNLYDMNFGTALFRTVTTGTAYQVVSSITGEPPSILTTKKYTSATAYATAEFNLDGTFQAWKANLRSTGTTTLNGFDQILISKASPSDNRLMPIITANGAALTTSLAYSNTTSVPTGFTIETSYAKAVSTTTTSYPSSVPTGTYTYNTLISDYSYVGTSNGYLTRSTEGVETNYVMSSGYFSSLYSTYINYGDFTYSPSGVYATASGTYTSTSDGLYTKTGEIFTYVGSTPMSTFVGYNYTGSYTKSSEEASIYSTGGSGFRASSNGSWKIDSSFTSPIYDYNIASTTDFIISTNTIPTGSYTQTSNGNYISTVTGYYSKLTTPVTASNSTGYGNVLRFLTDEGKIAVLGGYDTTTSTTSITYSSYFEYAKTVSGNSIGDSGNFFLLSAGSVGTYAYSLSSLSDTLNVYTLLDASDVAWSTLQARGLLSVTTSAVLSGSGSAGLGSTTTFSNNNPTGTTIFEKVGINNVNNLYSNVVGRSAQLGIKIAISGTATNTATGYIPSTTDTKTFTGITLTSPNISNFPTLEGGTTPLISNEAFTGTFNQRFIWAGDSSSNNLQSQLGIGEVYSKTIDHVTNPIILAQLGEYGMYGLMGLFSSNGFFSSTLFTQTEEGQFGIKNELTSEAPFGQYLLPVFSKNTITSNFDTRNAAGNFGEYSPSSVFAKSTSSSTTNGLFSLNNTAEGTIENYGFFSASTFTVSALKFGGFGQGAVNKLASAFSTTTEQVTATSVPFRVLFFDSDTTDNGLYVVSGLADYKAGELTAINTNPTGSSAMGGRHTIVKVEGGSGAPIALSDINLV